jgi:transposase-like protein
VQQFLPLFAEAAHAHRVPVGGKWRVDETYCRLNGRWAYCYRAIDQDGQVVDAYFSERRNAAAAQAYFERAINQTGVEPEHVITDRARCYPPALRAILPSTEHRCSKYLNNALERDLMVISSSDCDPCGASSILRPLTLLFADMPLCRICAMDSRRLLLRSSAVCGS